MRIVGFELKSPDHPANSDLPFTASNIVMETFMRTIIDSTCTAALALAFLLFVTMPASAQSCTAEKQQALDSCATQSLQDCNLTIGGNCEQRYETSENATGRFREVCCCNAKGQVVTKPVFAACKSKMVSSLGNLNAVLGTFAIRTRLNIKALSYATCASVPCDEF